jgi:hypothetical protein
MKLIKSIVVCAGGGVLAWTMLANCSKSSGDGAGGSGGSGAGGGACVPSTTIPLACGSDAGAVDPSNPLLTDFNAGGDAGADAGPVDWSNANGKWGVASNLTGSVFGYRGPNTTTTDWPTPTVMNGALVGAGTVAASDYTGIGMSFDQCVNAPTFTGVSFTLTGSLGGCKLEFQLQTLEEQATANNGLCNTCVDTCYLFPVAPITATLDATTPVSVSIPFSSLENTGMPATAADFTAEMLGFQWQLTSMGSACTGVSVAISDVAFTQ